MDYKYQFTKIILGALILCHVALSQNFPNEPIFQKPESYQRQFVSDFLEQGRLEGFVPGYPKESDHASDFRMLTKYTNWALPLVEERLNRWMLEPQVNAKAITDVVNAIEYAGTIAVFDVIARVFAGRPELRKWIQQPLLSQYGSAVPNFASLWYHALEYPDPEVREAAKETMLLLIAPPHAPSEQFYAVWGEAIVDRHKKEPTMPQLLQDPIVEIVKLSKSEDAEIVRQKIATAAKKSYARRQRVKEAR